MGLEVKCMTDVMKKDIAKIQSTLFKISPQTIGRIRMEGEPNSCTEAKEAKWMLKKRVWLIKKNLLIQVLDEGELYDAEEFLKEALEYVDDSLKTIPLASTILFNLGVLRLKQSDLIRAESVLRQSLSLREQWFGKSHPLVADVLKSLAQLLATSDYKKLVYNIDLPGTLYETTIFDEE